MMRRLNDTTHNFTIATQEFSSATQRSINTTQRPPPFRLPAFVRYYNYQMIDYVISHLGMDKIARGGICAGLSIEWIRLHRELKLQVELKNITRPSGQSAKASKRIGDESPMRTPSGMARARNLQLYYETVVYSSEQSSLEANDVAVRKTMSRAQLGLTPARVVKIAYDETELWNQLARQSGYFILGLIFQNSAHGVAFYHDEARSRARLFDPNLGEFSFKVARWMTPFFSDLLRYYDRGKCIYIWKCHEPS